MDYLTNVMAYSAVQSIQKVIALVLESKIPAFFLVICMSVDCSHIVYEFSLLTKLISIS